MSVRTKIYAGTAGALLCALVTAGCSGSSPDDEPAAEAPDVVTDGVVSMTVDGPLTGYDPAQASTFQDAVAVAALYDTLVYLSPDGELVPGLAESWESTATTATLQLRTGVTCSDGTALTADMVAASLNRLFAPETASPLVNQVIGAGNSATASASGSTVTVTMANAWSDLVLGLAGPFAAIVCPSGLSDPASLTTTSAGTGAFVSESQVTGSSYTLTRRTDYTWGPAHAMEVEGELPQTLVMQVVDDENTRANLLETGELQVGSFSSDAWNRFDGVDGVGVETSAQSDTLLVFNHAPGRPTADPEVRLAIAQAIDREMVNSVQSYGEGELLTSLGQDTYECFDPGSADLLPEVDAEAATGVLDGLELRVIGTNILAGGDANDYLQAALEQAGATVSVSVTDNQAWVSELFGGEGDWDLTIFVYGNRLSSMIPVGNYFVHDAPPDGINIGSIDNPAATAAFDAAKVSSGEDKCDLLTTFQQELLGATDVLPLATAPVHVLFAGGTSGVVIKGFAVPSSIRVGGN